MAAQEMEIQNMEGTMFFRMPWRTKNNCGELLYLGETSARIKVPHPETGEIEPGNWTKKAVIIPITKEEYLASRSSNVSGIERAHSAIESPVAVVHRICDEMVGAERVDILKACVDAGVNPNTAKTQYYHWKKKQ